MTDLTVTSSIDISASPEQVWRAITDPTLTKLYMFGCEAISDWNPGSKLEWRDAQSGKAVMTGTVVAVQPRKHLEFTTQASGKEGGTTVAYDLEARGDGTRLQVKQGDFRAVPNGEQHYQECANNWQKVLPELKKAAEGKFTSKDVPSV